MPRRKCNLNVTVDNSAGDQIERVAKEAYLRYTTTARILFEQRFDLLKAGWKFRDKELAEVMGMVTSLDEKGRQELMDLLREWLCPPEEVKSSVEGLVEDSYFQTGVFPGQKRASGESSPMDARGGNKTREESKY